jgi:hypothetical protein
MKSKQKLASPGECGLRVALLLRFGKLILYRPCERFTGKNQFLGPYRS